MKIIYLTANKDLHTGWGRFAFDLAVSVEKLGHDVLVIKSIWDNRKLLKNCDIIHAIDGKPCAIVAALANIVLRKKLVITAIGTYSVAPLYNWHSAPLLSWAYKKANAITAISKYTKSRILEKLPLLNITVITPGIDYNKFHLERNSYQEPYILSVGPMKHRKGYHISIPAFAIAQKTLLQLKYKIVAKRQDIGISIPEGVEFLEHVSDEELKKLYREAKLFILTSVNHRNHFEGFGLVFLEAAAAGLPVIGTLGNGIEDAVDNGRNGLLVPQNDISATAEAITKILSDVELGNTFSHNSYQWAQKHSLDIAAKQYVEMYLKNFNA